jgi:hypothetical protein
MIPWRYSISRGEGHCDPISLEKTDDYFPRFYEWMTFFSSCEFVKMIPGMYARCMVVSDDMCVKFDPSGEITRPEIKFGEYFVYQAVVALSSPDDDWQKRMHSMGYHYMMDGGDVNKTAAIVMLEGDLNCEVLGDTVVVCGPRAEQDRSKYDKISKKSIAPE